MQRNDFTRKLEEIAKSLLYEVHLRGRRVVFFREDTLLTVTFEFVDEKVFFYLYTRTHSGDGPGDRTDMNDMFSTLPALFLRVNHTQVSCTLFDLEHPVNSMLGDYIIPETEVYARYIVLTQPHNGGLLLLSEGTLVVIRDILEALTFYEMNLHSFIMSDTSIPQECSYDDEDLQSWASLVAQALSENLQDKLVCFNKRSNPHWYYYRSIASKISAYFAPLTAATTNFMLNQLSPWERLDDQGFYFFKSQFSRNAATQQDVDCLIRLLTSLEGPQTHVNLVPIENRLIAVGNENILFLECDCDRKVYGEGRLKLIERRRVEREFMFDGPLYEWANAIDGERFEELVRDLLSRKPNIVQVRSTSVTNEPDANADLICMWDTEELSDMPQREGVSPMKRRKIVVQCKAWAKNIGKNDVPNIRDTLDRYDADGMLIVSSRTVTRSLFEHLESLRRKGIWADYWNRPQLEDLLDDNPDLLAKYGDVVWEVGCAA